MKCSSTKSYDPYCELPEVSKSGRGFPSSCEKAILPGYSTLLQTCFSNDTWSGRANLYGW